jgi:DNA-binding response OmpR family regulator
MTKKVMIVDDEESVLKLLLVTLEDEGYHLMVARDGEEALTLARREKPDLVFLDMLLPKMDGIQVCQALRADPATTHMKIVMLTALAQGRDHQEAMKAGADDYVTKPFSPALVLKKVEDILHGAS